MNKRQATIIALDIITKTIESGLHHGGYMDRGEKVERALKAEVDRLDERKERLRWVNSELLDRQRLEKLKEDNGNGQ